MPSCQGTRSEPSLLVCMHMHAGQCGDSDLGPPPTIRMPSEAAIESTAERRERGATGILAVDRHGNGSSTPAAARLLSGPMTWKPSACITTAESIMSTAPLKAIFAVSRKQKSNYTPSTHESQRLGHFSVPNTHSLRYAAACTTNARFVAFLYTFARPAQEVWLPGNDLQDPATWSVPPTCTQNFCRTKTARSSRLQTSPHSRQAPAAALRPTPAHHHHH